MEVTTAEAGKVEVNIKAPFEEVENEGICF
ncbi:MAG: hypothetical protein ACJAXE_002418 [Neolewinella sp.]|jgi:hypothetical protein